MAYCIFDLHSDQWIYYFLLNIFIGLHHLSVSQYTHHAHLWTGSAKLNGIINFGNRDSCKGRWNPKCCRAWSMKGLCKVRLPGSCPLFVICSSRNYQAFWDHRKNMSAMYPYHAAISPSEAVRPNGLNQWENAKWDQDSLYRAGLHFAHGGVEFMLKESVGFEKYVYMHLWYQVDERICWTAK